MIAKVHDLSAARCSTDCGMGAKNVNEDDATWEALVGKQMYIEDDT